MNRMIAAVLAMALLFTGSLSFAKGGSAGYYLQGSGSPTSYSARGFSPESYGDLIYRNESQATTSGSNVTKLPNQAASGSAYDFDAALDAPQLKSAWLNGMPVVSFDGTNDGITLPTSAGTGLSIISNAPGLTIVTLQRADKTRVTSTTDRAFLFRTAAGGVWLASYFLPTGLMRFEGARLQADSLDSSITNAGTYTGSRWQVHVLKIDYLTGQASYWIDGVQTLPPTAFGTSGGNSDAANAKDAYIASGYSSFDRMEQAAMYIYREALSDATIGHISDQISKKYHLRGLPVPKEWVLGWYDAWQSVTTDDSLGVTTVSRLDDLAGGDCYFYQDTKANQPSVVDGAMDGDGATQDLIGSAGCKPLLNGKTSFAWYMVIRPDTTYASAFPLWFSTGTSATAYRAGLQLVSNFRNRIRITDSDTGTAAAGGSWTNGAWILADGYCDTSTKTCDVYKNETLIVSQDMSGGTTGSAYSSTDSLSVNLFSGNGTAYFDGGIRTVVFARDNSHRADIRRALTRYYLQ